MPKPYCVLCFSYDCDHAKEMAHALQNQEEAVRPVNHAAVVWELWRKPISPARADWFNDPDAYTLALSPPWLPDAVTSGRERLGE